MGKVASDLFFDNPMTMRYKMYKNNHFILGEIECKEDSVEVLEKMFRKEQNEFLQEIAEGNHFTIMKDYEAKLSLAFTNEQPVNRRQIVSSSTTWVFVRDDLKFFA